MGSVYNSSKLAFHKDKALALSRGEITSPIYVRVKPTNTCDHNCFYCGYNPSLEYFRNHTINRRDFIPSPKMEEILSDFKEMGVKAVTYSGGGEPLIYKHIVETLRRTKDLGIELSIITNGQNLEGERAELLRDAEWVRISVDSCTAEVFSETRRVPAENFNKLVRNIQNFSKIKKKDCVLGVNFVIHKGNKEQVYGAPGFFRDFGVDNIKFSPVWTPNLIEYHASHKEMVLEQIQRAIQDTKGIDIYSTIENDFKLSGVNQRTYEHCYIMQTVPSIGADCKVYFCQDKAYSEKDSLGSLKDKSFKELWFSEAAKEIFRNFNPKERCQHHCTYDARNIAADKMCNDIKKLQEYVPDTDKHKNFI